jgi:2-polyprenyl-6-methoxyphenol hydroxylase-like FAD-dependent oxidoreductase
MKFEKAAVVGSGMGGLVTARVLADHFESVVLIDRDSIPEKPVIRAGVPQGNHFHGILPGGLNVMCNLFPGFDEELEAHGSVVPKPDEFYAFTPEGKSFSIMRFQPEPIAAPADFPKVHIQTRALLEHCLRQRVEQVPNIETRYDTLVRDLLFTGDRVTGVKVEENGSTVEADLVIDATGRVSRTLGWLDELGFDRPEESHLNCEFAYTTVFFRPRQADVFVDAGYFMAGDPESEYPNRGGALIRMEDGSLLATVGGRHSDHPPKTLDGFMEFAKTLIEPGFHETLIQCDPISEPHHFKFPKGIRRHYERLERFPEGLLPIADAICHYNPVYGQGMSAASRQAVSLGELLEERSASGDGLDGLWRPYFAAAFEQTRAPWLFAAMADLSQEGTTGDFPEEETETVGLMMKLAELADGGNAEARYLLSSVGSMMKPLSALEAWSDE